MKFLLKSREKLGYKLLNKKVAKVQRHKSYHNIESAKTIGVLFDSTIQANYFSARRFISYLTELGKNVSALGMVINEEMLRYYTPCENIKLFSLEKLNFWCFPNNQEVDLFINKDFDILINICTSENLSADYVLGLSISKFKVSIKYKQNDFSDFALEFKDGRIPETDDLIDKIKLYLTSIKKSDK
ncbi:MAG: hypothetical protein MJ211_06625 [Bacteroidales bacterium]|nr:hypothetical protein [Bacteroidales bacterium]